MKSSYDYTCVAQVVIMAIVCSKSRGCIVDTNPVGRV